MDITTSFQKVLGDPKVSETCATYLKAVYDVMLDNGDLIAFVNVPQADCFYTGTSWLLDYRLNKQNIYIL